MEKSQSEVVAQAVDILELEKKVITPLIHQHPWLVIFDETTLSTLPSLVNRTSCSCQLFDPTYKKLYTIDMSGIHNLICSGRVYESKYGWLLISLPNRKNSYEYVLFAYTPFSSVNNLIELPIFESENTIYFVTFTSNPSMDQDCLFIVLHKLSFHDQFTDLHKHKFIKISTCRRGDKSWSTRYLNYSGPGPLWEDSSTEIGHWIYSEGSIYKIVVPKRYYGTPSSRGEEYYDTRERFINRRIGVKRVPNVKLLEPKRIVKWPDIVKSHGIDGESLYGSLLKLDDEDHDDSKYWVSKLKKEFFDLIYHCCYTSDCDYGTWDDMKGRRTILKIDPPPHQSSEKEDESMERMKKSQSEVVAEAVKTVHKSVVMLKSDRWLDLLPDILELIMKRLSYTDLIYLRAVCKSWNSVVNREKKVITPLIHQYPWLVIFDKTTVSTLPSLVNRTSCSCQLFDPTYKKLYTIDMSSFYNLRIETVYESKYGWLLISPSTCYSDKYVLFAYTPFSSVNNFILLPTFDESRRRISIYFATFTSNPSMDQDCLFIVLHNHECIRPTPYNSTTGISTCRRADKSWSTCYLKYSGPVTFWPNFEETGHWIYSEGNIYYVVLPKVYYGTQSSRNEEYYKFYGFYEFYGKRTGVTRVLNVKLLEPIRIVKWPDAVLESHGGTDDESLYGSHMKLDDEDHDDSKYWVSKLKKEFSDLIYPGPYTSDCDYGTWDDMKGRRKILKIDPPPHQ